jgi:beta-lactamase regulating signal transducer with metallopeptidase domain
MQRSAVESRPSIIRHAVQFPEPVLSLATRIPASVAAAILAGLVCATIGAIAWIGFVFLRVRRLLKHLRPGDIDGTRVLLSDSIGPAVLGVFQMNIVVPRWLLALNERQRRIVLDHEREHIAAFDPALLAAGATVLALQVWNVVFWGIAARLRQAIESDCDRRVIAAHGNARFYGETLLAVYTRSDPAMPRALAFVAGRSNLERRIARFMERSSRVLTFRAALGALMSVCLIVVACETAGPTRTITEQNDGSAHRAPATVALATSPARCLSGSGELPGLAALRGAARERHPEAFKANGASDIVVGLEYDENCSIRRDTVVRGSGGPTRRGSDVFLATVFGDTTGLAAPRGVVLDRADDGRRVTVAYVVRPSPSWMERVAGTSCGFGLRSSEVCSNEGQLELRLFDSTRVLVGVRSFGANNRPIDRLFLVTLSHPVQGLESLTMRHAFVTSQSGAFYMEDLLSREPLLLFSVSSSTALESLRAKRDVRVLNDIIGVAQYSGVRLTLEQIDRLRVAATCGGPRGSCYEVEGIRVEFPA